MLNLQEAVVNSACMLSEIDLRILIYHSKAQIVQLVQAPCLPHSLILLLHLVGMALKRDKSTIYTPLLVLVPRYIHIGQFYVDSVHVH